VPALVAAGTAAAGVGLTVEGDTATVTFSAHVGHPAADGPAAWETPTLADAFAAAGRQLSGAVRVVVVRGDTWSLPGGTPGAAPRGALLTEGPAEHLATAWQEGLGWLAERADLLTVAAVGGPASGAGARLALSCDLRVLTTDATLTLTETGPGALPAAGVTGRLVELLGYPRALDLCLTGRPLTATEAHAAGVAQRLAPPGGLAAAVDDLVAALLAVPRTLAAETKALLRGAPGRSRRDQLAAERAALARLNARHPAG
jgi:enoyl-CoA hydratase/carnithine racemase